MAMIPQRSLKQFLGLNRDFWNEVSRNQSVPQSVKSMIYQHMQSLWIPEALAVVISPLSSGKDSFLKLPVFDLGGIQYYYPSLEFWLAHAEGSHPPAGQGCDPQAHAAFLTSNGSDPEFIYSVVKKDGTLVVEDLNGFVTECAFYLSGSQE